MTLFKIYVNFLFFTTSIAHGFSYEKGMQLIKFVIFVKER
jgi:hypothetical protein